RLRAPLAAPGEGADQDRPQAAERCREHEREQQADAPVEPEEVHLHLLEVLEQEQREQAERRQPGAELDTVPQARLLDELLRVVARLLAVSHGHERLPLQYRRRRQSLARSPRGPASGSSRRVASYAWRV